MDLELVSIEDKVAEAIVLVNLSCDGDCSLVAEQATKLDIVDGEGVMCWFGPDCCKYVFVDYLEDQLGFQRGPTRLAECLCQKP